MRCLSLFPALLLATASVCAQSPALGQPVTASPATAAASRWPSVGLNVLFLNRTNSSESIPGLSKIQVVEDRVPQSVESVLDANDPISLCFLIDDSESTKELSQAIVRSAATIADSLPPKSEIAIIHFADKAFVDLPLTPIEKVDPKSFSFAQHRGATAFYDATVATVEYLAKRAHYRRRAIVLITDGVDNESTLNLDQAVKRMSQPSAPILYALFFRENNMSGAELRHATRALEILTNASGGLVFRPVEKKGVRPADAAAEAANSLATAIHSQIVVTYTSSNPSHDGKPRNVEVTLPKTQSEIRFQRTYIAVSKFGGM